MTRRLFIPAALALAAAAAVLLGACKANDTASGTGSGATQTASKTATQTASKPATPAAATRTTTVDADGVRRVTVAELQKMLEEGSAVIYDTRSKMDYDREHVKGASSLPFNEVSARKGELPSGKTLVFYCT
jgi:3-mercaptopyruvate sulfurtransferase SseA